MEEKGTYITKSFEETQKIGEEFAEHLASQGETLQGARVICLYGDLGSGKTTFVQGMAKGLGIDHKIISPTFILIRNYEARIKNYGKIRNFYHIDLYRIESEKDIRGLGIQELINDSQNIIIIEWAEKMKGLLPIKRIDIRFEHLYGDERKITIPL